MNILIAAIITQLILTRFTPHAHIKNNEKGFSRLNEAQPSKTENQRTKKERENDIVEAAKGIQQNQEKKTSENKKDIQPTNNNKDENSKQEQKTENATVSSNQDPIKKFLKNDKENPPKSEKNDDIKSLVNGNNDEKSNGKNEVITINNK